MANEYMGEHSLRELTRLMKTDLLTKVDVNDPRLTDARTPKNHAATHGKEGADPITPAMIGAVSTDDIVNNLESTDPTKVLSAAQGKALSDKIDAITDEGEGGFMTKDVYDTDDDGIVDKAADADKLGNKTASEYLLKTELEAKIGAENGIAPLDSNGLISSDYLPSYVDDVIEGYFDAEANTFYEEAEKSTPIKGETGKIYLDLSVEPAASYRFSGTKYVRIVSNDMTEITAEQVKAIWDAVDVGGTNIPSVVPTEGNVTWYSKWENTTQVPAPVVQSDGSILISDLNALSELHEVQIGGFKGKAPLAIKYVDEKFKGIDGATITLAGYSWDGADSSSNFNSATGTFTFYLDADPQAKKMSNGQPQWSGSVDTGLTYTITITSPTANAAVQIKLVQSAG